jgi:rRNA maturation RNase YbeY
MADTEEAGIQIFNQSATPLPLSQSDYEKIIKEVSRKEDISFKFIEVVYVDEEEIISINKEHLDRDYITDIITFRYSTSTDFQYIEGTLFCCAPRIVEQAKEFNENIVQEFKRIFIHGLLHLAGYDDQSDEEKETMTAKENFYLSELE